MKKIISILITISMLLASVPAFAISGTGTASNPYLISTASDIAKIHNDLDGYYKLTNNINMAGVAFEPIGDENEGAFTGTIDGAGYTISNLNINLPENKYVGFVGYLEGTVKNLNLSNVEVYGYRYVGGLVGYIETESNVLNCTVSGRICGQDLIIDINIGGIAGLNKGIIENSTSNGQVEININNFDYSSPLRYTGGIAGYNIGTIDNSVNVGNITSIDSGSPISGGISGYNDGTIRNCCNKGTVYSTRQAGRYETYAGGIAGYNKKIIDNCNNVGEISATGNSWYPYAGGIAGGNAGQISTSSNNGTVFSETHSGGVAGDNSGAISNCYNTGAISSYYIQTHSYNAGGIVGNNDAKVEKCYNSGTVLASYYYDSKYSSSSSFSSNAGGVIGYNNGTISNCMNSGYIYASSRDNSYAGGITGTNKKITNNCYNLGNILVDAPSTSAEGISGINNGTVNCCYSMPEVGNTAYPLYSDEISNKDSFVGFDFNNNWCISPNISNGAPQLQNMPRHIDLNKSLGILEVGESISLSAYIDGNIENVVWTSDNTSIATISSNGLVVAKNIGSCTITATNSEGLKANCLIYVYSKADTFSLNATSTTIVAGRTKTISYTQNPNTANEVVIWSSSDENIATVDSLGKVKANKKGNTTITATTANSKLTASCEVTVVGAGITSIYFTSSSVTMNVGKTKTLSYSISPSEYAGSITWSSSNENVATVDQNGKISGHSAGTTIITALSDTGKTAQCTVTVKAPATSINLNKNEITLEAGYSEKLVASMLPTNSTDTISWSSSSTTYASVSTEGIVTAKRAGQTTITATTTSGQKAYCIVKVVNPVVPVASVTLDKTEHIMTKSETIQLKGSVLPSNATNKDLSWSTSDDTVVSVNENGVVTANGVGIATITATSNNGMYHECIIKVVSASGPSIVLTPENAIPNAISKVKASIVRNPGISGYKFTINYDDALLTPISVTVNEEFGGAITTNLDDANRTEFNVVWYSNGDTDIDINGELFTIDFKVAETAELGDYSDIFIEYGAKDICNTAGENIALYTEPAKVTVEEPLPGDIYEDGDVNIYDLTLLARYMIGLADFTDRQLEAANVTDDELVDIKDVVKLAQYVVGWTGIELMSLMSLNTDVPETPTVTVGTASVNDANEADIPVYIKNNTGIAAYRFVLDYNTDDIEIVSITPSDFINSENFGTNLGQENDEGLIVFCYQEGNAVTDSELFTIKVRYKNPTDTSVSPISIKSAENNFCNQAIENVAVNYETGYALGDDYIVTNKVVDDTNFTCELYFDDSYAEQSAKAIIAFYDADGRMVQLMPKDITVKSGKVDLSIDYDKKAYATYKLMIWEGMSSLKPITDVK